MSHQRELSDSEKKEIREKAKMNAEHLYRDKPHGCRIQQKYAYQLGYDEGSLDSRAESVPMDEFLKVVDSIKYVIKNYTEVDSRMYDNLTEIVESIAHLLPK